MLNLGIIASGYRSGSGGLPSNFWTPAAMSTYLWVDADDSATLSFSSGRVLTWQDKSGNGRHLVRCSGTPGPLLVEDYQNSRDAVYFDAFSGSKAMQVTSMVSPSGDPGITIVSAFKRVAAQVNYPALCTKLPINTQFGVFLASNRSEISASLRNAIIFRNNTNANNTAISPSGTVTDNQNIIYVGTMGNPGIANHVQGVETAGTQGAQSRNLGTTTDFIIGSSADFSFNSNRFDGYIYEFILIADYVDTDTRQLLEGYIAHKWGLLGSLPSGHPYKTLPPTLA